ncbi:MAG: hypothetical protein ACI83D_000038 [Planctomycetota bacterium]|jgi:hypothetical protein
MRNIKRFLIFIIIIGVAWYFVSPLWRQVEVHDASPIDQLGDQVSLGQGQGEVLVAEDFPAPLLMLSATAESYEEALSGMSEAKIMEFEEAMVGKEAKILGLVEQMPEELGPQTLSEGLFTPAAHNVKGRAEIIQHSGGTTLRLEEFQTINGPKLHIYLATDTDVTDFIDLGEIRGTRGDINYEVPADTDFEKYDTVLVWCEPFNVLFSYADLELHN